MSDAFKYVSCRAALWVMLIFVAAFCVSGALNRTAGYEAPGTEVAGIETEDEVVFRAEREAYQAPPVTPPADFKQDPPVEDTEKPVLEEILNEVSEEPEEAGNSFAEALPEIQYTAISNTEINTATPGDYYIKINRAANTVTIYEKDENGEYTVPVCAMVCSTGAATPLGTYYTSAKYDWRALFGNVYGQYATKITGNILFHSVPYSYINKNSLLYNEYNKLGTAASQGCIRLSVKDAKWLYDNCPSGTIVTIYDDDDPGPLGKPAALVIDTESEYRGWDPTDPDPDNPWLTGGQYTPLEIAQEQNTKETSPLSAAGESGEDTFINNITDSEIPQENTGELTPDDGEPEKSDEPLYKALIPGFRSVSG